MTYTIIVEPNYLSGTINAPQMHRMTVGEAYDGEDREVAVFATEAEAESTILLLNSETYYLSHGEASRPSYEVVDEEFVFPETVYRSDALDLSAIRLEDIPKEIRKQVEESNVEYYGEYNPGYDVYQSDPVKFKGYNYCRAFVVSVIAVADADGDLSYLSWDNPTYYKEEV